MKKSWTRNLYLIGLVAGILLGVPLIVFGLLGVPLIAFHIMGGTINANPVHASNSTLYVAGVSAVVGASLCVLVAWIGALLKTISLRRWGWFISLLFFSGLALFAYSFVGPETPSFSEEAW
ncbi:hypothetical protein KSC_043320 [Ktedonobacter sp. SOSP1-52]|uniref:hypothetical protein n=1 Tax=Ktedonobacter sp. SOSP1-52 TaxID=2778366 RepID=UPI001915E558|nr:hypothetical protein [Ktedonobacter sp. SOSP1-52]GHO65440.1 hypothetical protein KSC_043320 [Ktedonobacter sp. SOSP1-52]